MDLSKEILEIIKKRGSLRPSEMVHKSGFSRVYVNKFFRELVDRGEIVPVGRTNKIRYVLAKPQAVLSARKKITSIRKRLINRGLDEDLVLEEIKRSTGIYIGLTENVSAILDYAFTEMLNNAIEHSRSREINLSIFRMAGNVRFEINDKGIGVFNNIMRQHKLDSELAAVDFILKGKQTTAPKNHSGEGIFFTSKVGDLYTLQSGRKKLVVNNEIDDFFIRDVKRTSGTRVSFLISERSKRSLDKVFQEYGDSAYSFSKTKVSIRLHDMNSDYLSRSQARRVTAGLEKFSSIIFDFKNVKTVGQAFADEIFRIFQEKKPTTKLIPKNMNQNVAHMIKRAVKPR